MDDILEDLKRSKADAMRGQDTGRQIVYTRAIDEIERLRALLTHADDVVIWEHTPARAGFQEEIEEALGIGDNEQREPK